MSLSASLFGSGSLIQSGSDTLHLNGNVDSVTGTESVGPGAKLTFDEANETLSSAITVAR